MIKRAMRCHDFRSGLGESPRGLVILSKGLSTTRMGENSCQPFRVAARIGDGSVARLGNRITIAFTVRLALTNSGSNAHGFYAVTDSHTGLMVDGTTRAPKFSIRSRTNGSPSIAFIAWF